MEFSTSVVLVAPALALMCCLLIPNRWAAAHCHVFRTWVTWVAGIQALLSTSLALALAAGLLPSFDCVLLEGSTLQFGIYYDGVSCLMLALVSVLGWIISRFSEQYLDGESNQGTYYRFLALTVGSVSVMVMSGNLLLFIAAWIVTSFGLHHLLLHYADRPASVRAAWTKFSISRVGDVALVAGLIGVYREFGTWEFASIFLSLSESQYVATSALPIAGGLLILGAAIKSAQFPFHTWLPLTLETPTPVSALMHAGVVNAGGYLIIRLSPLLSLSPQALNCLAVLGAVTACFAVLVMSTQTSVKGGLAYSTIAQMGFMMLQCGLGAFSAAMLHILAHSLYKSSAFLSSGSVLAQRAAVRGVQLSKRPAVWSDFLKAAAIVGGCFASAQWIFGISPWLKPGGWLLGGLLCLGLAQWLVNIQQYASRRLLARAVAACLGMCLLYSASYWGVDALVAPTAAVAASSLSVSWLLAIGVGLLFAATFTVERLLVSKLKPAWLTAWRVHASNGFYVDAWLRRTFGHLASS